MPEVGKGGSGREKEARARGGSDDGVRGRTIDGGAASFEASVSDSLRIWRK